jgi:hypothetical protein
MSFLENLENAYFNFDLEDPIGIHDTAYKQQDHVGILAGDDKSQTDLDKI